ncbi:MAG: GumC family protein [Sphingorhabdus sp.]|uniref:GumC family protein n=1 Tax=Sphingorhabdus sp. TaxID=1902408 RepID=UPI0038FC858D
MSNAIISSNHTGQVGYLQGRPMSPAPQNFTTMESSGIGEFTNVLLRHKKLVLSIIATITLSAFVWQITRPTLYNSTVSMQVELIDSVGVNQADIMAKNNQRIANEVKLHRSRAAAEKVVRDLELYDRIDFKKDMGKEAVGGKKQKIRQAASTLMQMSEITSQEGSDLVEITVESRSAEMATLIANQYPLSVQSIRIKKSEERSNELLASLTKKQEETAKRAEDTAKAVSDFRIANGMLSGAAGNEDLNQVNRIQSEAISASALSAGSSSRSAGVAAAAGMRSTAGATNASTMALEKQEADLTSQLASKSETFGNSHPEIITLSAALGRVRQDLVRERSRAASDAAAVASAESARMAQIARSDASGDAARAGQLKAQLNALTGKAYNNIRNVVELETLSRQAEQAVKAYNQLTERVSEIRAKNPLEGVNTTVVSPASVNDDPVSPQPFKITTMALLASAVLAFLVAFAIDLFDNKLRNSAQIRKFFGLPTFGMLPFINADFGNKIEESPVLQDPQSLFSEVARAAYFDVNALSTPNQCQTVLITSPLPGDGKSVVSVTLAAAAMAVGKRVAVIDLDLRKTGLIQQMKRADTPDLIEILKGHVDFAKIAPPMLPADSDLDQIDTETAVDTSRIALISATKPVAEPARLLGSRALQILLADLRNKFDFIVINAPATLAVKDARTMCSFADHTVVVARWGKTTIDQMNATMEMLGTNRVAGVIFDQVNYEEHARGRYGDAIQYYWESASYYSDIGRTRSKMPTWFNRFFGKKSYLD